MKFNQKRLYVKGEKTQLPVKYIYSYCDHDNSMSVGNLFLQIMIY